MSTELHRHVGPKPRKLPVPPKDPLLDGTNPDLGVAPGLDEVSGTTTELTRLVLLVPLQGIGAVVAPPLTLLRIVTTLLAAMIGVHVALESAYADLRLEQQQPHV